MFRTNVFTVVVGLLVVGSQELNAETISRRQHKQLDEVGAACTAQQLSLDQETQRLPTMTYAADAAGGARYFGSYQAAASFARSISGGYYTSITSTGRWYRVDYWAKGSHG
jgi:hypothetical protein